MPNPSRDEAITLAAALAGVTLGQVIRRRRAGRPVVVADVVRASVPSVSAAAAVGDRLASALGWTSGPPWRRWVAVFAAAAVASALVESIPGLGVRR